jgi:ferredoxin--NADP+ reductase
MSKLLSENATIVDRFDLTETLAIFRVAADRPPTSEPWFTSGQYCVLGANNVEAPTLGGVGRAMSIASAPEFDGPVEFYIRRVAHPATLNPLTHLLWKLNVGDRVYMGTVAAGTFTIRDTVGAGDPRVRMMVAAGTGLAPFISMIRSEMYRDPSADLSGMAVLHGVSYPPELGYRDELLRLTATNGLRYWGTVSRGEAAAGWTGDIGRVESFFEPTRLPALENRIGLPHHGFVPRRVTVFVCGPTGTIAGTMRALIDRGFVPRAPQIRQALGVPPDASDSFFYEQYDPQPVIDIHDPAVILPLRSRMQTALTQPW